MAWWPFKKKDPMGEVGPYLSFVFNENEQLIIIADLSKLDNDTVAKFLFMLTNGDFDKYIHTMGTRHMSEEQYADFEEKITAISAKSKQKNSEEDIVNVFKSYQ